MLQLLAGSQLLQRISSVNFLCLLWYILHRLQKNQAISRYLSVLHPLKQQTVVLEAICMLQLCKSVKTCLVSMICMHENHSSGLRQKMFLCFVFFSVLNKVQPAQVAVSSKQDERMLKVLRQFGMYTNMFQVI